MFNHVNNSSWLRPKFKFFSTYTKALKIASKNPSPPPLPTNSGIISLMERDCFLGLVKFWLLKPPKKCFHDCGSHWGGSGDDGGHWSVCIDYTFLPSFAADWCFLFPLRLAFLLLFLAMAQKGVVQRCVEIKPTKYYLKIYYIHDMKLPHIDTSSVIKIFTIVSVKSFSNKGATKLF